MATLEELREKLDGIDDQIAKLYEERMKVCEDVGRFKVGAGRKVFDRQREHEKLLDVASKVNGEFNKKGDSGAVRTADEYEPEIAVSAACGGGCTGKTSVY